MDKRRLNDVTKASRSVRGTAADEKRYAVLPNFKPKAMGGTAAHITVVRLMSHAAGLDCRFQQKRDGVYARAGVSRFDGMFGT